MPVAEIAPHFEAAAKRRYEFNQMAKAGPVKVLELFEQPVPGTSLQVIQPPQLRRAI